MQGKGSVKPTNATLELASKEMVGSGQRAGGNGCHIAPYTVGAPWPLISASLPPASCHLMANASSFLPPLSAATSHLGRLPRPAQVSARFLGLR